MKQLTLISFCFLSLATALADTTEKPIKFTMAYPISGPQVIAQIGLILEKTDILKTNGLDTFIKSVPTEKDALKDIAAGNVEATLCTETGFILLRGKKVDVYAVSSLGSLGRIGLAVKGKGGEKKLAELKGHKFGMIFETIDHQKAVEWRNIIGANTIGTQQYDNPYELLLGLESNAVGAIVIADPFLENGIRQKKLKLIDSSEFYSINIVTKAFLEANPKAINKFNNALKDAFFYYINHEDQVNGWYAEKVKLPSTVIAETVKVNKNHSVKKLNEINLQISAELKAKLEQDATSLEKEKLILKKPDLANFIK
jgi:ABC-type nitrate/sulfonate/bicarbonate transport system substrate-binding protein